MPWSPEQLQKFEETSPSDASDALLDDWVAYLLSPQPQEEAPGIWGEVGHTFDGPHPSADTVRQALLEAGDDYLPVALPWLRPTHITDSKIHTFYHKCGGRHVIAAPSDDEHQHQHRNGD